MLITCLQWCPHLLGLLCSEILFPSRTLAQSSEDEAEGVELLGVRPPKRSPSPEPENFLLPPLSLVCWVTHVILWPSEPSGLKPTVLWVGKPERGRYRLKVKWKVSHPGEARTLIC